MNRHLFEEILQEFVPSPIMRNHINGEELSTKTVVDLILGCVASLEKKLRWVKKIYGEEPDEDTATVISDIERAIKYLEGGENIIFTVTENIFNPDYYRGFCSMQLHPAKNRFGIEACIYGSEEYFQLNFPMWWQINSSELDSHGLYHGGEYWYCYARTEEGRCPEPVFFVWWPHAEMEEYEDLSMGKERIYRYRGGWSGLKLSVPFKKGDIMKVHGLPFEDERSMLLINDNSEKLTALAFDKAGKEEMINLSNGKNWLQGLNSFGVAPYYRMDVSTCDDLSRKQRKRFETISEQLKQ